MVLKKRTSTGRTERSVTRLLVQRTASEPYKIILVLGDQEKHYRHSEKVLRVPHLSRWTCFCHVCTRNFATEHVAWQTTRSNHFRNRLVTFYTTYNCAGSFKWPKKKKKTILVAKYKFNTHLQPGVTRLLRCVRYNTPSFHFLAVVLGYIIDNHNHTKCSWDKNRLFVSRINYNIQFE